MTNAPDATVSDHEHAATATELHRDPTVELMARPRLRWAARVFVVLPIVAAVVRALVDGWFPVGDDALLAVRAYDVGTAHHPWLGSWTSASLALGIDVNNPGPLYFDLVAPAMWTVGRIAAIGPATAIGVGAVNAAAAIGTMLVASRLGGWRAERWAMLLVATLGWSMGSALLIDIWQPHALLFPFVFLLSLTVGLISRDWRLAPWWTFVASVVVQTHVAYAYVLVLLSAVIVIAGVIEFRRADWTLSRLVRVRTVSTSALVLALCWIQPVIEQLFGTGRGNLSRLASSAGGGDVTVGAGQAGRLVAAIVALPGWTRWGFSDTLASRTPLTEVGGVEVLMIADLPGRWLAAGALVTLGAVLIALTVWTTRIGLVVARSALVVAAVCVVAALVSVTIQTVTVAGFGSHQVRWLFALGVFVHIVVLAVAAEWLTSRWTGGARVVGAAVSMLIVVLTLVNLPAHAHPLGPTADQAADQTLARTFVDLAGFDPPGPVVFDVSNVRVFEPYSSAIVMALREQGVDVRFDDEGLVRQYGETRRVTGDEVGTIRQYEGVEALLRASEGDSLACVLSLRTNQDDLPTSSADDATVVRATLAVVVEPPSLCDD